MKLLERAWLWLRGYRSEDYSSYRDPNAPPAKTHVETLERSWLTEDEIVDAICAKMTNMDLMSWLMQPESDLIRGHHGVGQTIRNEYLWHNPKFVHDDPQHDDFPDQVSMRIIRKVWARAKNIAVERGMVLPTPEQIAAEKKRADDELPGLIRGVTKEESALARAVREARGEERMEAILRYKK